MLAIELRGKRALVAGVADDGGFGFAIAKSLAEAGATIVVGTWPPAFGIFKTMLERGKFDESLPLSDGRKLEFEPERSAERCRVFEDIGGDLGNRRLKERAEPIAGRRLHARPESFQ